MDHDLTCLHPFLTEIRTFVAPPCWYRSLKHCGELLNAFETLMISVYYPQVNMSLSYTVDHDYGVFISLFLPETMMQSCQLCPTKYLLLLGSLRNSYSTLGTRKFTKIYLRWIDRIIVLPMILVMSC